MKCIQIKINANMFRLKDKPHFASEALTGNKMENGRHRIITSDKRIYLQTTIIHSCIDHEEYLVMNKKKKLSSMS